MDMTFEQAWIEHDYNPFIVFNQEGKVISLNQEAQYLLGEIDKKEIFDISKTYANHSYGFKTTIIDLSFGTYKFHAITIGYIDENEIGIKLYKVASKKFSDIENHGESVNLYSLLDLCIGAASTRCKATFKKEFDPTFPDLKLQISNFTKLLNKIYKSHDQSTFIKTKLSLVTGEHIRFEDKKYPIFSLHVKTDYRDKSCEQDIEEVALECNVSIRFDKDQTILTSAMVSL